MSIERTTRNEVFIEYTKSICPVCKVVLDAEVNIRDAKVYLRKRCREHGEFEALVYSDADAYLASAKYNKPGTLPLTTQTEIVDGCPTDCGLCPAHKQHACLGVIEVNTNCNLDCPICFADSGHQPDGYSITLEQCARMLDVFVEAEGEPEVVMFSGGEPTIHKNILDFIDLAQQRPINTVNLNTNGIRLATDRKFVQALGERNRTPGKSVNIYLQFDGFNERTHLQIRGKDLRERKRRALDNCADAGLSVTLVAAIERGLNEHEVGDIVRYGIEHPAVRSVAFQPVTHSGRHIEFDPLTRLTNPDVIGFLTGQCPDWFVKDDFFPVPCCFPTCRSITYLLVDKTEDRTTVVPIPRLIDLDDYLDYVTNRVMPDPRVRAALETLWSASAGMGSETTARSLAAATAELECASCGIDLPAAVKDLNDKAFMIVIQDFQDPYTLNVKQLMKCCVEEITPDGRLIPFCAYNSVGYREQVRSAMSGVQVADVAPNAAGIQNLLAPTVYGSKTAAGSPSGAALSSGETSGTGQTNLGMPAVRR
ncbi:radical SAM protein [Arthrobacter sp. MMS18-M83]|uniref:radical SAM protein n=1 Tax=Arthrobacter sp. MMS18-M83 TaxID=2996261 RepID=UPI00227C3987|nr:radical SAM protein [Arthrobacter sp. MMS18-M83]WAH98166.1 radical SAM protein [Arthrobacter sp. MMS18-M83]